MEALPRDVHILVIDDNDALRNVVAATLRHAGFVVTEAAGVGDGLVVLSQCIPDAVLTDHRLSDGSGLDVLEHVVKLPARPAVIVMGGALDEKAESELLAAGAAALLHKPFPLRELVAAIAASLAL